MYRNIFIGSLRKLTITGYCWADIFAGNENLWHFPGDSGVFPGTQILENLVSFETDWWDKISYY